MIMGKDFKGIFCKRSDLHLNNKKYAEEIKKSFASLILYETI